MRVEVKGLDGVLDMLKQLPAEVVSARGGPVKLALMKGARVIRDQAKKNLDAAIKHGGAESTGLLMSAVSVVRGRARGVRYFKGERVVVMPRKKTYKNAKGAKVAPHAIKTATLMEYGSTEAKGKGGGPLQPARPWLRPAFNATAQRAIDVTAEDLKKRVDKLAQKYLDKTR